MYRDGEQKILFRIKRTFDEQSLNFSYRFDLHQLSSPYMNDSNVSVDVQCVGRNASVKRFFETMQTCQRAHKSTIIISNRLCVCLPDFQLSVDSIIINTSDIEIVKIEIAHDEQKHTHTHRNFKCSRKPTHLHTKRFLMRIGRELTSALSDV